MRLRGVLSVAIAYAVVASGVVVLLRHVSFVRVAGRSMYPALESGDLAIVARRQAGGRPLDIGDIALIEAPGHGAVLHRVVGRGPARSLLTKGDANETSDLEPVRTEHVTGRVVGLLPVGKVLARWRGR